MVVCLFLFFMSVSVKCFRVLFVLCVLCLCLSLCLTVGVAVCVCLLKQCCGVSRSMSYMFLCLVCAVSVSGFVAVSRSVYVCVERVLLRVSLSVCELHVSMSCVCYVCV